MATRSRSRSGDPGQVPVHPPPANETTMFRTLLGACARSLALTSNGAFAQGSDIPFIDDINLNVGQSAIFYCYIGDGGTLQAQLRLP